MSTILNVLLEILITVLAGIIEPISKTIDLKSPTFNLIISAWLLTLIIILLIVSDLLNFAKWYRREGFGRAIYFSVSTVLLQAIAIILFWYFPQWINLRLTSRVTAESVRWLLLFGLGIAWYISTRNHSGYRGFLTYVAHLAIFLLGWSFGQWIGVLLLSIPLLLAFYFTLYHIAMAIVPAADPGTPFFSLNKLKAIVADLSSLLKMVLKPEPNSQYQKNIAELFTRFTSAMSAMGGEKWKRFLVMVWYMWGVQYPHLVVPDTIGRRIETRIPGSQFKELGAPGLIWCQSNQVIGITTGPKFARVEGPGIVFTRTMERPVQIADSSKPASEFELVGCVDLRTQLRSSVIEAVTKDGNPFQAVFFTAFAIDRQEEWSLAEYHRLQRANPILKAGKSCDRRSSIYPYNQARIQAALGTTAINNSTSSLGAKAIHWDDWVLNQLCESARLILSHRNLDELWRPRSDGPGKNALDEIGSEIKTLMAPKLQEFGIQLFTARVVNYIFSEDHPVVKQQIATWSAAWEKRAAQTLADGQAEAGRLELEARAYARYMFLTMVANSLEKAPSPKHVVAMRIIGAMEELLRQQPGTAGEDSVGHLTSIKQRMFPPPK